MAEEKKEPNPFIAYTTAEGIPVYGNNGKITGKQFKVNILELQTLKRIANFNAKQSNNMLYILNSNYLGSRKALTNKARTDLKHTVRSQLQTKLDEHLTQEIISTYKELADGKREIEDLEEHQREFFQELLDTKAIHKKWTNDVVEIKSAEGDHNSTSALTNSQAIKITEEIAKHGIPKENPVLVVEQPLAEATPSVDGLPALSAEELAKAVEPVAEVVDITPAVDAVVETKAKKK